MELRGVLLKFGEYKYMIDLLVNGKVYCNTLHYFANCDNNYQRDEYEIATDIYNFTDATMEMKLPNEPDSAYKSLNLSSGKLVGSLDDETPSGNIYCLNYSPVAENDLNTHKKFVSPQLKIGDYCIVITNPSEFIRRLRIKINDSGYICQSGLVVYSDFEKLNGKRTPFMKHITFEPEKEFRIYIDSDLLEPIAFKLGNIEDIAFIMRNSDVPNLCYKIIE